MIRVSILAVCVVLVVASRDAAADPPCHEEAKAAKTKKRDASLSEPKDKKALEHLEKARRAFGVKEYDLAINEYKQAGLLDDAPLILWNLGQTYREAKDYENAIRHYRLFVERGNPGEKVRALAECFIDTMQAELDQAASTAPPTGPAEERATGAVAEDPPETAPTISTPPEVESVRATSSGRLRWTAKRRVAVGAAAVGVVAFGAGVVFGLQSQDFKDTAAGLCPSEPCADADEANRLGDRASSRALLANISYGASAAMVATAAVLWYLGAPSSGSQADHATVAPAVTPGFAGLVVGGRF